MTRSCRQQPTPGICRRWQVLSNEIDLKCIKVSEEKSCSSNDQAISKSGPQSGQYEHCELQHHQNYQNLVSENRPAAMLYVRHNVLGLV